MPGSTVAGGCALGARCSRPETEKFRSVPHPRGDLCWSWFCVSSFLAFQRTLSAFLQRFIAESVAEDAGIQKRVYPHLPAHRRPAPGGPGNTRRASAAVSRAREAPETTQRYYEPKRTDVKEAFEDAMSDDVTSVTLDEAKEMEGQTD